MVSIVFVFPFHCYMPQFHLLVVIKAVHKYFVILIVFFFFFFCIDVFLK